MEVVNVEHEEVLLVPRWVKCKRVTFKYGLGDKFINVLKTLKMLGLDSKQKILVKGSLVAPRDVVAACLPEPSHLGDKMSGKTCAGTWVTGTQDGQARRVFMLIKWPTTIGACGIMACRPWCGRPPSAR